MVDEVDNPTEELPAIAGEFAEEYPDVWATYADLGETATDAGPLDDDAKRLVKLGIALSAQSEGAVHSHTRRALDEGIDPEKLKHVAVLSIPTIGFPQAMAGLSWIADLTNDESTS